MHIGKKRSPRHQSKQRLLLAGMSVVALTAGGTTHAETQIPNSPTGYTLPGNGNYTVAAGITVGEAIDNHLYTITLNNAGTITDTQWGIWNRSHGGITNLTNSGTIDGILLESTIDTLVNSGTIRNPIGKTVNRMGILLDGSPRISTLSNTGTIHGDDVGIFNAGAIGSLTNLGTISGGGYGIFNHVEYGTLGTLTNAQHGLTFAGALPTTYNTYFNTASDFGTVVFTTGGTLLLLGEAPRNFTATDTSLTYGLAKADGVSYVVGTYSDVVASDAPLSFTYAAINGFRYSLNQADSCAASSYCYDLTISSAPTWGTIGQGMGGNGQTIGQVLDRIASQGGLSSQLASLDALPAPQQVRAINQLGAATLSAVVVSSGSTTTPSNTVIGSHMNNRLSRNSDGHTGISAGDAYYQGALWGQVLGNHTSLDSSSAGSGFSSNAYGLLFGVDLHVSDKVVAGAAVNWLRNDAKGRDHASGNSSVTDTYQLNLYGTWRPTGEALWFQGLTSAGLNHYDQKRNINYLGEAATAEYHGWQAQAKLTAGYDVAMLDALSVTPMGSLRAARVWNRGYTETGSSVNQSMEGQSFNSVESVLGIKLTQRVDTGWGTLTADAQAGWLHDHVHSPIVTVANLSGVGYVLDTARLPSNGAQVSLGGTLEQGDDLSLRLEYQGDLRPGYASHTGLLTLRQNF